MQVDGQSAQRSAEPRGSRKFEGSTELAVLEQWRSWMIPESYGIGNFCFVFARSLESDQNPAPNEVKRF